MASFPILWVGPAGSGKLTKARAALGAGDLEPRLQTLEIGEYSARYWEFPTHMEVDIMDLSMMDKQILPELLNKLLSTRDVTGSGRKVMILRHIHGLSPPAAVRLRVCLEELVWSPGAPAMIWCTARTVNSAVAGVMDGFVYRRVPGPLEAPLRTELKERFGLGNTSEVRSIQTYIAEMLRQMVVALGEGSTDARRCGLDSCTDLRFVRSHDYGERPRVRTCMGDRATRGLWYLDHGKSEGGSWCSVEVAVGAELSDAARTRTHCDGCV